MKSGQVSKFAKFFDFKLTVSTSELFVLSPFSIQIDFTNHISFIRDYLRKDKRQKLRNQIINVFLSSPFLFFSILERERDIYIYIFYINSSIRKREKEKK